MLDRPGFREKNKQTCHCLLCTQNHNLRVSITFVIVAQSLSCVWLFATPWTAAWQTSLSFTTSQCKHDIIYILWEHFSNWKVNLIEQSQNVACSILPAPWICGLPICSWGFPPSSVSKESACNAGDSCSIPGLGRSPGEGNGNPLQYSCLKNPMDRGAWQATIRGVARVGHLATKPPPSLICSWETGKFLLQLVRSSSWETSWFQINICQCRNIRDANLIPESGRSPGEGNGNTRQYSCLKSPMDRGARQARVHGLTKIQIWLSN